jgi:hypothetical protein
VTSRDEKLAILEAMLALGTAILGVRGMVLAAKRQDERGFVQGFEDSSNALDSLFQRADELIQAVRKDG